jgi:hypothetical protein
LKKRYKAALRDCDEAKSILDKAKVLPKHSLSENALICADVDYDHACDILDFLSRRRAHYRSIMRAEHKRRMHCKRDTTLRREQAKRDLSPSSTARSSKKPLQSSDDIERDRRNTLHDIKECLDTITAVDPYTQNLLAILRKIEPIQADVRTHLAAAIAIWKLRSQCTAKIVRVIGGLESSNTTEEQIKALKWHDPRWYPDFMQASNLAAQASELEVKCWYDWGTTNQRQWQHQMKVNEARWNLRIYRYMMEALDAELEEAKSAEREHQRKRKKRQEEKRKKQMQSEGSPNGSTASSRRSGSSRKSHGVRFEARTPGRGVQKG